MYETIFGYWAHDNKTGKKVNFMSNIFADVGERIPHKGKIFIVDDWFVDKTIEVPDSRLEVMR